MIARVLLVAALAALAGPVAIAGAGEPPIVRPPGDAARTPRQLGSELFAANCATCHGSRGGGVSAADPQRGANGVRGVGPSLRGVGALAADFYLTTGYMPLGDALDQPVRSRQRLHPPEVRALVSYVASLGNGPAVPSPHPQDGDVAQGLELFTEHCAGCHQVTGQGGVVTGAKVPPLAVATTRQVAEAVRIGPYVMPRFSKRAISDAELTDIVAYVRYAQHPRDAGGWSINRLGPFPEGLVAWFVAMTVLIATCVAIGSRVRS